MSDLLASITAAATPKLEEMADTLADEFLGGMKAILANTTEARQDKVKAILKEGARFKWKALTATNTDTARNYAEAVETSVRRVKTILISERIVAEEATAALVSDLWGKALDGLVSIAKGLLTTIATGLVQGAIKGLAGGEGGSFDPSDIFPFA